MTNWLERLNQLYTHRCSCTLLSVDRVISVTRLVGLRPIHPCAHRAFCSHPFKCLHIQGTVIYSKGPSHIWWCMTVFHFYSCRPTLCGWLCRLDRAVCACVAEEVEQDWGAREEWLCETATDRQMGGGEWVGVRRVRVQGSETNKEWSCWWLKGSCTRNSSILIGKRISRVKV